MSAIETMLSSFQVLVYDGVARALKEDPYCKSYEGTIELVISLPDYFQRDKKPGHVELNLHCYVLGPSRHYSWSGYDVAAVFAEATEDVMGWINEAGL